MESDSEGNVCDVSERKVSDGVSQIYINMLVISRMHLLNIIEASIAKGYNSFLHDIIIKNVGKANFKVYEYDGWYAQIGSMAGYFDCSMQLLDANVREQLFGVKNRPVLTKVRNSAPTRYCDGARVVNSVVAEGCIIEGTVENSIIFRGVHVGKGAVVKNCVLFQDTYVCPGVNLNCVITDKNVVITDRRQLSGCEELPFYIQKGSMI